VKGELDRRKGSLTRIYNKLNQMKERIHANIKDIKKLFDHMKSVGEEERIDLRLKIRNALRELIDVITVFPAGYTPEVADRFKALAISRFPEIENDTKLLEKMDSYFEVRMEDKKYRRFMILFSNGAVRSIGPDADDVKTLEFEKIFQESQEMISTPFL
jgi:hypothetical protein